MTASAKYLYDEELYSTQLGTLVILPTPWTDMSDEDKALLGKILNSVKLSLDAVKILTMAQVDFQTLTGYQGANVLNFGATTVPHTTSYQPQNIDNFTVLSSEPLPKLDDARKKQLWQALKDMYRV